MGTGGSIKEPYYIHSKDSDIIQFAGLFYCVVNDDGDEKFSCTILTTDSNNYGLECIHERMPIILDTQEKRDYWMNENDIDFNILLNYSKSTPLNLRKVSSLVNSIKNNSSECRMPVKKVKEEALANFFTPKSKNTTKVPKESCPIKKEKLTEKKNINKKQQNTQPTLSSFWNR